jgi:response regulator RpfG family c-di-GMP phosphodiesterase
MSGTEFDPEVVEAFLRMMAKKKDLHPPAIDSLSPEYAARSPK